MSVAKALRIVERDGIVLVFPLANRNDPPSLWSGLHPASASEFEWRWDQDADPRVAALWHLRERLARSKEVVYAKWFRGRATFFSLPVWTAMLATLAAKGPLDGGLSREARDLLEILVDNSPQSTKQLRNASGLTGKARESTYQRAMKELWSRLLIVGVGEVDDGAFPSLAVAATELFFEESWLLRHAPTADGAQALGRVLGRSKALKQEFEKSLAAIPDGR